MKRLFSALEYLLSAFGGVVTRVKGLRGRMPPSGMISEAGRQVNGLFESLLAQSFDGGR
jgi:hypothetical protein